MHETTIWLKRHQLGHLVQTFERHAIGLDVLDRLTGEDFKELGIALGDRYRLQSAISAGRPKIPPAPKAHLRHLTVLFSDLVDSTWLSEQLNLEEYRGVLQAYQAAVASVMGRYEGTITRFEGDGILVLFGFPEAHEDDPERAVRAALDSVAAVASLPPVRDMKLASRVGLATGDVVVGDEVGEGPARQVVVTGSTPNLAARLQGLAGPDSVVISDVSMRLITTVLDAVPLPPAKVKGLSDPVQAYVVRAEQELDRFSRRSARGLTPLVARDVECDQLRRTWQAVQEGEGKITVVLGEAGIGKSRLLNEFLADVPSARVLRFFCQPRYQNSTLHPIVRQLQDATGVEQGVSPGTLRARLADVLQLNQDSASNVLDVFQDLLSPEDSAGERSRAPIDRQALFDAILTPLTTLTSTGAVALVVEDLHWADPTTLELLERVIAIVPVHPVFLLATVRPDFIPEFTHYRMVSTIKLMPLTQRESMSLIQKVSQGRALSATDRNRIAERCDGVPLYLEEITRAALDKVEVSILEHRSTGIPETLRDLLMARLDRLGAAAELAQIASVFGRHFTSSQLQAVADLSEQDVASALEALQNARVITRQDVAGKASYQFNHALTADAAYGSMLSETKRELHAKVARILDADPKTAEQEPETAAWHYEWAGEVEPAIRLRELAGNRASARSANVEAAYHLDKAVKLVSLLSEHESRHQLELRLRVELGTQLIACYGNAAPQVEANFERARELCDLVSDERMRWQTLYGLWSFNQVNGRLREARELGETLITLAARLDDAGESMQAHRAHGLCLFAMGDFDQSQEHLERAIALYDPQLHSVRRTGDISDLLVLAKCNLGWLCCFRGEQERGLTLHDEAIGYAEQLHHQHSLAFALALAAASRQALGDRDSTRSLSQRLVQLSERHSYPYWLAWGEMLLAWAQADPGDEVAASSFDSGLKAYRETGAAMMMPYFLTLRAEIELAQGLVEDALVRLEEAEQLVEQTATRFYAAEIPRLRALALSRLERIENVRPALEHARFTSYEQGNALLVARIETTFAQLAEVR